MTKGAWLALAIALFVVEICAIQVFSARVCIGGFDPTSARAHWSSKSAWDSGASRIRYRLAISSTQPGAGGARRGGSHRVDCYLDARLCRSI